MGVKLFKTKPNLLREGVCLFCLFITFLLRSLKPLLHTWYCWKALDEL